MEDDSNKKEQIIDISINILIDRFQELSISNNHYKLLIQCCHELLDKDLLTKLLMLHIAKCKEFDVASRSAKD